MKRKKERNKFIILFITFILFSVVAPCIYLIVRFNLFTQASKLQIGFWGFVVFGIIIVAVNILANMYLEGLKTKWHIGKQIVSGFCRFILPMILVLLIITWLRDNLSYIIEALYVIIPCECVAIVVNPLPKWCFENNVEGAGEIVDKIFKRKNITANSSKNTSNSSNSNNNATNNTANSSNQ